MPALSDAELMARIQAGRDERFEELIFRYQGALYRVALSRLGDHAAAEDVVQETFLAAFRGRHTYRPQFSFRTWLWTILLNQCRGYARKQNRRPKVSAWSDASSSAAEQSSRQPCVEDAQPAPLAHLLVRERQALLELLLDELTQPQADALRLRFFGELKFQEIAETMGCSLQTAKNRVRAGLERLSEKLARDGGRLGRGDAQ